LILDRVTLEFCGSSEVKKRVSEGDELAEKPWPTGYERGKGVWSRKKKEGLTFHIDTLFFSEGRGELLHLGCKTTLGIPSSEGVMLTDVGSSWGERMIGSCSDGANTLD
jgi:hypothetical protein